MLVSLSVLMYQIVLIHVYEPVKVVSCSDFCLSYYTIKKFEDETRTKDNLDYRITCSIYTFSNFGLVPMSYCCRP